MSGDNGKEFIPNTDNAKPKDLVLTITLSSETNQLTVQAPGNGDLFDEPISFWMLDKAKKFIEITNARKQQSKIIQPRARIGDIFRKH